MHKDNYFLIQWEYSLSSECVCLCVCVCVCVHAYLAQTALSALLLFQPVMLSPPVPLSFSPSLCVCFSPLLRGLGSPATGSDAHVLCCYFLPDLSTVPLEESYGFCFFMLSGRNVVTYIMLTYITVARRMFRVVRVPVMYCHMGSRSRSEDSAHHGNQLSVIHCCGWLVDTTLFA